MRKRGQQVPLAVRQVFKHRQMGKANNILLVVQYDESMAYLNDHRQIHVVAVTSAHLMPRLVHELHWSLVGVATTVQINK